MAAPNPVRKRQIIIVGIIMTLLFGVMMLALYLTDDSAGKPSLTEQRAEDEKKVFKDYTVKPSSTVTAEEKWIALSEKRMSAAEQDNRTVDQKLQDALRRIEELEEQKGRVPPGQGPIAGTPVNPQALPVAQLPPTPRISNEVLPPPQIITTPNASNSAVHAVAPNASSSGKIKVVDFDSDEAKGTENEKIAGKYLSAGSFATVKMLTGVDAPTGGAAQSNPLPVLMQVVELARLPNKVKTNIRQCHIVGAAVGNISMERVQIRTETLSCVMKDNRVIEKPLEGTVFGEDGKPGFRGRVVERAGAKLGMAFLAGLGSGMGEATRAQYQQVNTTPIGQVTNIDPDKVLNAGLAGGFANSMDRLANWYIQRANEIHPVIEMDSDRIGEVVLTGGVDLGVFIEDMLAGN